MLRVSEIFYSLQGESKTVGQPTVFIRLTGCPLRCVWCDTEYAFNGGSKLSLEEILEQVRDYRARYVCVTGGEPLAQPNCISLLEALVEEGYEVSLETSGAIDLAQVPIKVTKVMDLKPPGSGELKANRFENIQYLNNGDQVKFVLQDRADYEWAKLQLANYSLERRAEILFSPVAGKMDPVALANWILEDRLRVRFQIQLHKYLWGNQQGV